MSKVFAIADTHFGHTGILGWRREFASDIVEHDQLLIDNWNKVVTNRDVVYVLGDFGLCKHEYLRYQIRPFLNGLKVYLVAGNHDTPQDNALFDKVYGAKDHPGPGPYNVVMTHIPIHPQEMYWGMNVHGHIHKNHVKTKAMHPGEGQTFTVKDARYVCVSAEHIGYTPVELQPFLQDHYEKYQDELEAYPRRGFRALGR